MMFLVHPTITPELMASYAPRCWLPCCLEHRLQGCGWPGLSSTDTSSTPNAMPGESEM
jgi:hypothetical protein